MIAQAADDRAVGNLRLLSPPTHILGGDWVPHPLQLLVGLQQTMSDQGAALGCLGPT